MSNLGFSVMLNRLAGNAETVEAFKVSIGKVIRSVELGSDDELHFKFEDGTGMRMWDDGQSCCESRYMRTDDDLTEYAGATLIGGEIKEAPSMPEEYGDHEVQFLEIQTSKGVFTMASHNEHNGYYGGFAIEARAE